MSDIFLTASLAGVSLGIILGFILGRKDYKGIVSTAYHTAFNAGVQTANEMLQQEANRVRATYSPEDLKRLEESLRGSTFKDNNNNSNKEPMGFNLGNTRGEG